MTYLTITVLGGFFHWFLYDIFFCLCISFVSNLLDECIYGLRMLDGSGFISVALDLYFHSLYIYYVYEHIVSQIIIDNSCGCYFIGIHWMEIL